MASVFFTYSERTKKNYTVRDALKFAQEYLRARNLGTCVNAVSKRDESTPITLQELNNISEQIIDDSLHYNVRL